MANLKNHLFKFRRILLPVTAAGNHFSSYPAVYFRSLLRRNFTFLYFRRILPPVTAAGNRFSSYPAVYFRSLLRRKFVFLHFHRTLAPCSTAGILLSSFPPYTCALSYGGNSLFHFPAVHLLSFLLQNFSFLHFPPYTCALLYGRNSFFHFPAVHLLSFLLQNFAFLHFPPYTCALLYGRNSFFHFSTVHLRFFLRQKFTFLHFHRTPTLYSTAEIHFFISHRTPTPFPSAETPIPSFPAVYFYPFLPQDFTFHGFQPKITAENSSSPLPAVLPYKELFSPSIIFHLKSGEVHPRIIPHPR